MGGERQQKSWEPTQERASDGSRLKAMKAEHLLGHFSSAWYSVYSIGEVCLQVALGRHYCLMTERAGSEIRLPKFISQSCHLLSVLSWANDSTVVP